MDEETKTKANIKLNEMKDYIGYPKEILNNTALEEVYEGLGNVKIGMILGYELQFNY